MSEQLSYSHDELKGYLRSFEQGLVQIQSDITTLQEKVHKTAISATILAWQTKDTGKVSSLLNALTSLKGFVRVESLAYWFRHIAGLDCNYDTKSGFYTVKFAVSKKSKLTSDLNIPFSYDVGHLDICKEEGNRFWLIAPVKIIELKVDSDLDSIFKAAVTKAAKALELEGISQDALQEYLSNGTLLGLIQSARSSKKVVEFKENYKEQQELKAASMVEESPVAA